MKKILIPLCLIIPAAFALDESGYFDAQDWELACDNTGTCRAAGYQAEETDGEEISLLFTRKAGEAEKPTAQLQIFPDFEDGKGRDTKATLTVGGKSLGEFVFPYHEDEPSVVGLDERQTAALLVALTEEKAAIVVEAGARRMELSHKGALAVLK